MYVHTYNLYVCILLHVIILLAIAILFGVVYCSHACVCCFAASYVAMCIVIANVASFRVIIHYS